MATDTTVALVLVILAAYLPPLLLALDLRHLERRRPEPWQGLAKAFLWGAFGATLLAFLLESLALLLLPAGDGAPLSPALAFTFTTLVLAPVIEESLKALGLRLLHDDDPEPEDGLIHGGMVGLGFAATENALYVGLALALGGTDAALLTALYRGVATAALHASASALAGYAFWQKRHARAFARAGVGLAGAILLHALYNLLGALLPAAAALLGGALALLAYLLLRRRIRRLDRDGGAPAHA